MCLQSVKSRYIFYDKLAKAVPLNGRHSFCVINCYALSVKIVEMDFCDMFQSQIWYLKEVVFITRDSDTNWGLAIGVLK